MQPATKTGNVTTVIGGVIIFSLTLAMSSLTISSALATPQIAKVSPAQRVIKVRRQVSPM